MVDAMIRFGVVCRASVRGGRPGVAAALGLAFSLVGSAAFALGDAWDVTLVPDDGFGGRTMAWSTGEAGTAFVAWNAFDAYPIDATPDAGVTGVDDARLIEATGQAFLTGGGNIYNFAGASSFGSVLSGVTLEGEGQRTLALRIETQGSSVDSISVHLVTSGGVSVAPGIAERVSQISGAGPGGMEEEWIFLWEGIPGEGSYTLGFDASAAHLSLTQLAVHVGPLAQVPEPQVAALVLAGLGGLAWSSRTRAKRVGP